MPETPRELNADSELLGGVLGTETISLFVGPERKHYVVHKKLLCDTVPYFSKLLEGPFVESKADYVNLNEEMDDPVAVELFCHWLYRSSLPEIPGNLDREDGCIESMKGFGFLAAETPYHRLYYMADKWCITSLRNHIIDRIVLFHVNTLSCVHPQLIVEGFEHTPKSSPLRRYLAESAACMCINSDSKSVVLALLAERIGPQSQDVWPAIVGVIQKKLETNKIFMVDSDFKGAKEFNDTVS
ncbi:hypothetical protein MMC26_006036 [Xylographa opegraphella]|nr:hypothetical protein [Xylographa opegraphella]